MSALSSSVGSVVSFLYSVWQNCLTIVARSEIKWKHLLQAVKFSNDLQNGLGKFGVEAYSKLSIKCMNFQMHFWKPNRKFLLFVYDSALVRLIVWSFPNLNGFLCVCLQSSKDLLDICLSLSIEEKLWVSVREIHKAYISHRLAEHLPSHILFQNVRSQ